MSSLPLTETNADADSHVIDHFELRMSELRRDRQTAADTTPHMRPYVRRGLGERVSMTGDEDICELIREIVSRGKNNNKCRVVSMNAPVLIPQRGGSKSGEHEDSNIVGVPQVSHPASG